MKDHGLAQVVLPSDDINADMEFFQGLGFRLEQIFPSDDPAVAIMSGHQLFLRLDKHVKSGPTTLNILTDDPNSIAGKSSVVAPNGTLVNILPKTQPLEIPTTRHHFEVRQLKESDPWVIGRAGMLYRDLIPDRLGGSIIASHINIPDGGPVPDMVHYHTVGFQLIFCYRGWVSVVYEDQGPPITLQAGDCVTQPPEIRHRVLEASDNLEVIEVGVPATHMTTVDHDLELPTKTIDRERLFQGQRFCHHVKSKAKYEPWRIPGFEYRDTGIAKSTNNLASVQVAHCIKSLEGTGIIEHQNDIMFSFVMEGTCVLSAKDQAVHALKPGDAFVIPPRLSYEMRDCSHDFEMLEVTLP